MISSHRKDKETSIHMSDLCSIKVARSGVISNRKDHYLNRIYDKALNSNMKRIILCDKIYIVSSVI